MIDKEACGRVVEAVTSVEWSLDPVIWRYESLVGSIRAGLGPLCEMARNPINFDVRSFNAIYGKINDHSHMFNASPIDWGFAFSEPQVTRGLAHFLSEPKKKVSRLRAFFTAFGVEVPDDFVLAEAQIGAETSLTGMDCLGRIDLEILYEPKPDRANIRVTHDKALIIEAKLGHRVTPEQLKNYRASVGKRITSPKYFILAQYEGDEQKMDQKERDHWTIVYWDEILIAFEKALLIEDDTDNDFRLFRRTLWKRVDGSNRKRHG